ncbi:MAG: carboxypeptidase regulatory-like domain-containing protein [Thermoguttaceae bacterium]|nr:carboxypeptidase regulatory-like domain-containing protein [Thermoguttaceae bacterium]
MFREVVAILFNGIRLHQSLGLRNWPAVISVSCLFLGILACGPQYPEGMPKLYPVTLQFVQEGQPLTEASVRLIPENSSHQWVVGGSTDAQGNVVLYTHGQYEGVPEGKYRITVNRFELSGSKPSMNDMMAGQASQEKNYSTVARKYTLPNQTPLVLEVRSSGNAFEPFELGKAVRELVAAPSV